MCDKELSKLLQDSISENTSRTFLSPSYCARAIAPTSSLVSPSGLICSKNLDSKCSRSAANKALLSATILNAALCESLSIWCWFGW